MIELDKLSLDQIIGEEIELIPLMNEEDEKKFNKEAVRSEEHTSELQSRGHLVCRLLLEKKNKGKYAQQPALSSEDREQVTALLELGHPNREIASRFQVSMQTIYNAVRRRRATNSAASVT